VFALFHWLSVEQDIETVDPAMPPCRPEGRRDLLPLAIATARTYPQQPSTSRTHLHTHTCIRQIAVIAIATAYSVVTMNPSRYLLSAFLVDCLSVSEVIEYRRHLSENIVDTNNTSDDSDSDFGCEQTAGRIDDTKDPNMNRE
jgi:hypothetical protein